MPSFVPAYFQTGPIPEKEPPSLLPFQYYHPSQDFILAHIHLSQNRSGNSEGNSAAKLRRPCLTV